MSVSTDKKAQKRADKKAKSIFTCVPFMLKYIYQCDKLIIPLKAVAAIIAAVKTYIWAIYLKWIIDFITEYSSSEKEVLLSDVFFLVFSVMLIMFAAYTANHYITDVFIPERECKIKNQLSRMFIDRAMKQDLAKYEDWSFYDTYTKTMGYADIEALKVLNMLFGVIQGILDLVAILSIVVTLDVFVLAMIAVMVVVTFADQYFSDKLMMKKYEVESTINRQTDYIKKVAHFKQYASEIRTYGLHKFLLNKLDDMFVKKYALFKSTHRKYWRLKYFAFLITNVILLSILLTYISWRTLSGFITIGGFSVLYSAVFSVNGNIAGLFISGGRLSNECEYYVSRLRYMLTAENEIEDSKGELTLSHIEEVEFSHVFFSYPGHEETVLDDVSFKINKGEHVALVGKNGAGKSTMVKLILRLYDVTGGQILINGHDIREYDVRSLRDCFATVLQDYQIFSFSIKDNMCFDKPIPEERIKAALDFTDMTERIENKCENGLDTYIGREFDPSGVNFSGGELQRLAIARGLARSADFCIWDEANSALDPFAEAALNKAILDENADKTMLIVTHRLTAAVSATKIIHIENGKLMSFGSHAALMESDPFYREMFMSQAAFYRAQREGERYEE